MDVIKREVLGVLHPYYLVNIFLSSSFVLAKSIPQLCRFIFDGECQIETRQTEIGFLLLIIIMVQSRKTGSMSLLPYLANAFMYCKLANVALWFLSYKPYGVAFGVIILFQVMLLPQPSYKGPQRIVYFSDPNYFREQMSMKSATVWIIEFYTVWNPACVNFASIFAELSAQYALENLKFGKVDLGRFPQIGAEYGISDSAFSKQLPTLILFESGTEVLRRPTIDHARKLVKFHFNLQNIVDVFDLKNVYKKCKEDFEKNRSATRPKLE